MLILSQAGSVVRLANLGWLLLHHAMLSGHLTGQGHGTDLGPRNTQKQADP